MRVLGLTGSIGMGKTTTAAMFAARGIAVYAADAAVHRLYRGRAAAPIEAAFPGVAPEGVVDRRLLSARVVDDPAALARLEAIVHPLVHEAERAFVAAAGVAGRRVIVLDIPLLFETGADARVDAVVVVTADAAIQRARVLSRAGMTKVKLEALLGRQMQDSEKRGRAHFLVDSGRGFDFARRSVDAIIAALAFTR